MDRYIRRSWTRHVNNLHVCSQVACRFPVVLNGLMPRSVLTEWPRPRPPQSTRPHPPPHHPPSTSHNCRKHVVNCGPDPGLHPDCNHTSHSCIFSRLRVGYSHEAFLTCFPDKANVIFPCFLRPMFFPYKRVIQFC